LPEEGVFFGLLLAATIRWSGRLRVSGHLKAETVTMVFDNGIPLEPDLTLEGKASLTGIGFVQAPAELERNELPASSAEIQAEHLFLSSIQIAAGTEITIDWLR
jgi:hypothetical protein